jgi:hypothetical protein
VTAADLATAADVAALDVKLDRLTMLVESLAARLPDQWLPVKVAADEEHCNCDPRTLVSAGERGEITIKRVGRRVLVLASSLRPKPAAEIAALARSARA